MKPPSAIPADGTVQPTGSDSSVSSDMARFLSQEVQLLVFKLADELFVCDIMRVNEIIRPQKITPVRRAPAYVRGVIELRDTIVPIIDLRARLGLPPRDKSSERATLPYVIIVGVEGSVVGVEVDGVVEVVRVERSSLKASPDITRDDDSERDQAPFILGVCPHQGRLLMLLNIKRLVLTRDVVRFGEIGGGGA